ncbi:DUF4097 domain-containing protein [Hymenobacter artigasi]|uniref:DUF4097 and DUF4098 domain-containing protein YvlB n=1 Tax=Hymenobacter artigasi TaxID=2719616 RepID=A0ABX1HNA2_9BACT|nr:DUF4097 family beta strand repeat-containing protein [Hymenobacter artigasi]NKI90411.1 DUF4097 and DUF4098 domain-containing protein YvlB [Hymenobacter artigasi]
MKTLLSTLALLAAALSTQAQTAPEPTFKTTCDNHSSWSNGKALKQFCETRDLTMAAPAGQPLTVSADPNGGITVHGWDGPNVRIRAKIQTWSNTEAEAAARARRLVVSASNNSVRTTDPEKENNWSVSYEIFVPRTTALALNTVNGGISLDNLQAAITFETTNGGVNLANLGGHVKGETTNGGVNITLSGSKWEGKGLDVATTNGGIHWKLPRTYSAQLFTSTNMGGIRTSLPVTKSGMFHKEVMASLGQGGATVKAVTTNGGIDVSQERD